MAALVAADYAGAASRLTRGGRLQADDLRRAVTNYGRTLVQPPVTAFKSLDVVRIRGAHPPQYSVRVPLWTQEEGRSDLTLELTVTEAGQDHFVEIDDLHVL